LVKGAFGSLLSPTTVTTVLGAGACIAVALVDAWHFHAFPFDQVILGAGLGALLGHNPLAPAVPAGPVQ
jgi:hypothetical protein